VSQGFSGERVRRGLWHFLIGRGLSSVAGIAGMLLVVRWLSVANFATYSVLVALVEIMTALTGLGLAHVVLRYVPELYVQGQFRALRGLIWRSFGLRSSVLALFLLLAALFTDSVEQWLGLALTSQTLHLFMVLLLVRIAGHFLSQCLESTLHQAEAQTAFTLAALVRLLALLAFGSQSGQSLSLEQVIVAELLGDLVGLLVLVVCLIRILRRPQGTHPGNWVWQQRHKLFRFAMSGYLQHLAILPYGGHSNRLVGVHVLSVGAMAAFGFAQSLYEYVRRYLPAQLLVGLIRPVVISRYAQTGDFARAAYLCQRVLQINLLLLAGLSLPLLVCGPELLLAISAQKYGAQSAAVLLALAVVLALETQRQQLELLAQTIERYDLLLPTNMLLSTSVLLAAAMASVLGPVAFPMANAAGLAIANIRVRRSLKLLGHDFPHDAMATAGTITMTVVASGFGLWASRASGTWWLGLLSAGTVFILWVACFRMGDLRGFYREITQGTGRSLPVFVAPEVPAGSVTPKVAFGVLSCRAESAMAVSQIARAVYPHPVIVHHDFSQCPAFSVDATNVRLIAHPVATAWGNWSLVAASYLLMEEALKDEAVTHFQMLSEACLPVRTVRDFTDYLQVNPSVAAMVDLIKLDEPHAFVSHGWRYLPGGWMVRRMARRFAVWAWGELVVSHKVIAGVNLRVPEAETGAFRRFGQTLGFGGLALLRWWLKHRTRQLGLSHLAIGSQWMCVSRSGAAWLLACRRECPELIDFFKCTHIPDEAFFQTLISNGLAQSSRHRVEAGNHHLVWNGNGSGPDVLNISTVEETLRGQRFFARKFALDPHDPARHYVLQKTGVQQ